MLSLNDSLYCTFCKAGLRSHLEADCSISHKLCCSILVGGTQMPTYGGEKMSEIREIPVFMNQHLHKTGKLLCHWQLAASRRSTSSSLKLECIYHLVICRLLVSITFIYIFQALGICPLHIGSDYFAHHWLSGPHIITDPFLRGHHITYTNEQVIVW